MDKESYTESGEGFAFPALLMMEYGAQNRLAPLARCQPVMA